MAIILFPYSQLLQEDLRNIVSLFGSLKIFQPWYLDTPPFISDLINHQKVKIFYPPINLKPRKEFKTLLSEYHNWIERYQDRSYKEILKVMQDKGGNEESTWEIRQMMRRMDEYLSTTYDDQIFRWHLLLHLANEVEIQRLEADRLLKNLQEKKPLLDGIAEGADLLANPARDLHGFVPDIIIDIDQIKKIIEAWFGLFREYLNDNEIFLTTDYRVLEIISDQWGRLHGDNHSKSVLSVEFTIPAYPNHTGQKQDIISSHNSNKKIINEVINLISEMNKDPQKNFAALTELSKEIRLKTPSDFTGEFYNLSFNYFLPISEKAPSDYDETFLYFSGKKLILLGKD